MRPVRYVQGGAGVMHAFITGVCVFIMVYGMLEWL